MANELPQDAGFSERILGVLKACDMSIRALQHAMEEANAENSGYSSVLRYVKGEFPPSLPWVEAAAKVLEVPVAWLAYGVGPGTDAEAQIMAIGDASPKKQSVQKGYQEPYRAMHEEGMITAFATQGVGDNLFFYIIERLVAAAPNEDPTPSDDLRLLSRGLQGWIQGPWLAMRRGKPASLEESADYHLAMMTALLQAVPGRGRGRAIREVIKEMGNLPADGTEDR